MMGFFDQVGLASPDPIFGLTAAYHSDPRPNKVTLTVGLYKNEDLATPILDCVKKAEKEILETEKSKEYLPFYGDKNFVDKAGLSVFGETFWGASSARICGVQTLGGTSALRVGADFLKNENIGEAVYLSDPTWPNHRGVFLKCGYKVESYPYYDMKKHALDFDRFHAALRKMPSHSVVLLHASCHNPTGADLNEEQWKQVSAVCLERKLLPFFDFAYPGFKVGIEEDAYPIRLFAKDGHEMLAAVSYSKAFSIYAERVGALFVVGGSHKIAEHIKSKLNLAIRPNYSNPPLHGAKIVEVILSSPKLKKEWEGEVAAMRERIHKMRKLLADALCEKVKTIDFSFLRDRSGLFSYIGLNSGQVERLIKDYGVYMTGDGRVNIAGLNQKNLSYVVDAISAVVNEKV